ncbi:tetratricopeptide repeat protein [Hymenobacter latericus]|uniref:tetratricopeptide repeat protein n=1 Tax=Hymenobacter sp. YIM 151858-1 TaxID=2987688 RepID=UPI002226FC0A|nr:tetratricopeptide repeat protein [Hymenobacter sp. YIM 151858-1]UYZ58347.1 tetratricopeptide repeat protein [Hymenobacter sp. YIM 151858-1]
MSYFLSEQLARLRTGTLTPLTDFYEQQRDIFSRWARRQFGTTAEPAHAVLREVLLEFYDQANDGRLSRWPTDLRAHLYGVARQILTATVTNTALSAELPLPASEADRRVLVLRTMRQLPYDSQLVLQQFYFHGSNFETLAVKLGYPNANVARRQKSDALRKLYEALQRQGAVGTAELLPHLTEVERSADGLMTAAEQDEFDAQMMLDGELRQACLAYEQYAADLRWAAGRETLRLRLESLDRRVAQRMAAQQRISRRQRRQRVRLGVVAAALAVLIGCLVVFWPKRSSPSKAWADFDVQEPGLPAAVTEGRPLLEQSMNLYRSGRYPAALHSLRRLPAGSLGQDTFLFYNGLLLLRQEQPQQAESYFQRVSQMPNSPMAGRATFYLGLAHWQQQELPQAQKALQRAAETGPQPHRNMAQRALREAGL